MRREDVPSLEPELAALWRQLELLRSRLRDATWARYGRANPFAEDLFEWKEKGSFCGGEDVTIYDSATVVGDVKIGDHTWVGPFCTLDGTGGLTIGAWCSIAAGAQIQTHDVARWALSGGRLAYDYAPVVIEDCCFVGAHAVVTSGVTIGPHSVVGAGAVVTHDVPAYAVAAGVPARVIGRVRIDGDDVRIEFDGAAGISE